MFTVAALVHELPTMYCCNRTGIYEHVMLSKGLVLWRKVLTDRRVHILSSIMSHQGKKTSHAINVYTKSSKVHTGQIKKSAQSAG